LRFSGNWSCSGLRLESILVQGDLLGVADLTSKHEFLLHHLFL
jgi:hypothetical protein